MSKGVEVSSEIAEHGRADPSDGLHGRDGIVTIIEAALLAVVALLAAWSGYAAAKWSTESRLVLARASTARIEANRATTGDAETLAFDTSTFNTWFSARLAGDRQAMDVATRRFRPEFKLAFDAWVATDPFTNASAPPGPTFMPEYARPQRDKAEELDKEAGALYAEGAAAADDADRYVRITVLLATVLFLVGISGHFRVRAARYGLVAVGSAILIMAVVQLILAPKPSL